eukprot:1554821-Rhodomonas_salina.1
MANYGAPRYLPTRVLRAFAYAPPTRCPELTCVGCYLPTPLLRAPPCAYGLRVVLPTVRY